MPLHDDLFVYRGLDEEDLKKHLFGCGVCKTHAKLNFSCAPS